MFAKAWGLGIELELAEQSFIFVVFDMGGRGLLCLVAIDHVARVKARRGLRCLVVLLLHFVLFVLFVRVYVFLVDLRGQLFFGLLLLRVLLEMLVFPFLPFRFHPKLYWVDAKGDNDEWDEE